MTVLEKIQELLDDNHVNYTLTEHEPVHTSEEAAKVRGTTLSQGAKALIFFADKKPLLIVVPGDKRANLKKFKKTFSIKDLRMASPEEVTQLTGLKIGAIPPIGKAINLPSYFDQSVKSTDTAVFNAGSHSHSIAMKAQDLIKIEQPKLCDIT